MIMTMMMMIVEAPVKTPMRMRRAAAQRLMRWLLRWRQS